VEDDLVLHLPERLVQIRRHRLRGGTRTVNADLVAGCDALHLGRYASRGAQPRRSTGKRQKNYAVRASALPEQVALHNEPCSPLRASDFPSLPYPSRRGTTPICRR
jgi:hypothetical protein